MLNKLLAFTLTLGCLGCAYGAPNLWSPAGANAAGVVFDIQSGPQSPPDNATSDSTKVTAYLGDCSEAVPAATVQGSYTFHIGTPATADGHSLYLIVEAMTPSIDPTTVHGIKVEPLFNSTDVFNHSPCVAATCDGESCQAIGQAPGSGTAAFPAPVTLNPPP